MPKRRNIGKWSAADNRKSLKKGWGLFVVDAGYVQIQKYDELDIFESDDEAREHVYRKARTSDLCARALYYIADHNTHRT